MAAADTPCAPIRRSASASISAITIADFGRIRAALGWEPRVALRDGLARTLAYYREQLAHYL